LGGEKQAESAGRIGNTCGESVNHFRNAGHEWFLDESGGGVIEHPSPFVTVRLDGKYRLRFSTGSSVNWKNLIHDCIFEGQELRCKDKNYSFLRLFDKVTSKLEALGAGRLADGFPRIEFLKETTMAQDVLTKRVEILEKQVAQLTAKISALDAQPDWRRAVGMFAGDEVMKTIFEEGRRIREADRRRAQNKKLTID
jgi:hypothetical protein